MMKKTLLALAFTVMGSAAFGADAVEGMWKTVADDNGNSGLIKVAPCGDLFCGVLVKSFDKDGKEMKSENIGKQIIWDMKAEGDGNYGGGKIWSPDRDKTYDSKMVLSGDSLTVKGCVFFICRDGGTWTRAN